MIEINLFEKKETNILPYLILLIFVIGIGIMMLLFFFQGNYYSRLDQQNQTLIHQQADEVALSRDIERVERLTNQNRQTIATLEENAYPIVYLTDSLSEIITNEEERVVLFDLGQADQLLVSLENMTIEAHSKLIDELNDVSYINRVHVTRLTQMNPESDIYQVDLTLDLNEKVLRGEALE
ncbi:hypothetical protein GCM10008932_13130 [Alkalibacterium iburiense]|uniref:Uncharacterized protein n=1 Tax=Alkalibacterium iburiense TaxID=290589 RepID=A0ABN0XEF0_9LACT